MKMTFDDLVHASITIKNFAEPKTDEEIFYELCFCLCAPQATFKNNIKVVEDLKHWDFYNRDYKKARELLHIILKPVRFYKRKAEFLIEAKWNFENILKVLETRQRTPGSSGTSGSSGTPFSHTAREREWLVKNVKGLGMKTASHLLRNLGATDLAIIDTHVLKYLKVDKSSYLDLEKRFAKRARRYGISVAELDAIVWKHYSGTSWEEFTH